MIKILVTTDAMNVSNHVEFGLKAKHFKFDIKEQGYVKNYEINTLREFNRDVEYLAQNQTDANIYLRY